MERDLTAEEIYIAQMVEAFLEQLQENGMSDGEEIEEDTKPADDDTQDNTISDEKIKEMVMLLHPNFRKSIWSRLREEPTKYAQLRKVLGEVFCETEPTQVAFSRMPSENTSVGAGAQERKQAGSFLSRIEDVGDTASDDYIDALLGELPEPVYQYVKRTVYGRNTQYGQLLRVLNKREKKNTGGKYKEQLEIVEQSPGGFQPFEKKQSHQD